jgi:hypothetical protein
LHITDLILEFQVFKTFFLYKMVSGLARAVERAMSLTIIFS